jgi:hypothetical protein
VSQITADILELAQEFLPAVMLVVLAWFLIANKRATKRWKLRQEEVKSQMVASLAFQEKSMEQNNAIIMLLKEISQKLDKK